MEEIKPWQEVTGRKAITRRFLFTDFKQAFSFMTAVALKAEADDHHPEWTNVYNRVDITLTTHDAGQVTEKDYALADYCDLLYGQYAR